MRFSFVFSLIFKNRTFFPYTSILKKNVFLITLKAKYQNVPIISEFCHMSWVTGSLLANLISKNFCIILYETPCTLPLILRCINSYILPRAFPFIILFHYLILWLILIWLFFNLGAKWVAKLELIWMHKGEFYVSNQTEIQGPPNKIPIHIGTLQIFQLLAWHNG